MIRKTAYATLIACFFAQCVDAAQLNYSLQTRVHGFYRAHPFVAIGFAVAVPVVLSAAAVAYYARSFSDIDLSNIGLTDTVPHQQTHDADSKATQPVCNVYVYRDVSIDLSDTGVVHLGCPVDAIVNAATESLQGGGGVDGPIHKEACPQGNNRALAHLATQALEQAAQSNSAIKNGSGLVPGNAVITDSLCLKERTVEPVSHIIHTVGPRDGDPKVLESCYLNSLKLAAQHNLQSIAFCSIGIGVFRFPKDKALGIALNATKKFIDKNQNSTINRIIFATYQDEEQNKLYQKTIITVFHQDF